MTDRLSPPARVRADPQGGDARPAAAPAQWHVTSCTGCPHRGTACGPGRELVRKLGAALDAARRVAPDLALSGVVAVTGCGRDCRIGWQAGGAEIWAFGDMAEGADPARLAAAARRARAGGGAAAAATTGAERLPERLM